MSHIHVYSQKKILVLLLTLIMLGAFLSLSPGRVIAQGPERPPIDMMLVIDNSCSMFPKDQILPECDLYGSDPDFLRVTGAEIFAARLGFGEMDEQDYQIGAISMGETPPEVYPLRPAAQVRDELAQWLSNPRPQVETQILPALEKAYQEVTSSPQHRPGNQPAIVLITDGRPYPEEGQTNADIKKFVDEHPNVPLFVILLRNSKKSDPKYDQYIDFWKKLGRDYEYIQTYRVDDANALAKTYNDILARLQNSNPSPGYNLKPNEKLNIYVDAFVQKLIITLIHKRGEPKGNVTILDPSGVQVLFDDPGVLHFSGKENQAEVISIDSERLDKAPRNDVWTIESDRPISVFLDYVGAYDLEFVSPEVSTTSVPDQYEAIERVSPEHPFTIQFKLVDKAGNVITEPQLISGEVLNPDGSKDNLRISTQITPDENGVYTIEHDFLASYPKAAEEPGRYMLSFRAGEATHEGDVRIPIAQASLLVDVGRGPYIASVSPQPLICKSGEKPRLTVHGGDLDVAQAGTLHVRVLGSRADTDLAPGGGDIFVGSVEPLCEELLANLACDNEINATFQVRMIASMPDGTAFPPSVYKLPVKAVGVACTPTPTPTATPTPVPTATPTPTPTPVPNTDGDRLNDLKDNCKDKAEWEWLPYFDGCPPPLWFLALAAVVILGLLALIIFYLIPMLWITFISPPPDGYFMVCEKGKRGTVRSIKTIGRSTRSNKIVIGKKGQIKIPGLQDKEFIIMRQGKRSIIKNVASKTTTEIRAFPSSLATSNPDIKIIIGSERDKIRSC